MSRTPAGQEPAEDGESPALRKRSLTEMNVDVEASELQATPTKRRRSSTNGAAPAAEEGSEAEMRVTSGTRDTFQNGLGHVSTTEPAEESQETPKATPRKRGRPPKNATPQPATPNSTVKSTLAFATPTKNAGSIPFTPTKQAADRSARRKSTRALIEHVMGDGASDDEPDDDELVREIYGDSEIDDDDEEEDDEARSERLGRLQDGSPTRRDEATTPTETPRRKGRPRKAKSPTPPRDLPPHELYFFHNKPGRPKTSNNTLSSLALLTHEEYFNILHSHKDRHAADIEYLESLHAESFSQWAFELSQDFGVCLYGFGSKRSLLHKFATHLSTAMKSRGKSHKTVIVNGYTPTSSIREILSVIGTAVDPAQRIPTSQPATMLEQISSRLYNTDVMLTLIINSIDAAPLRKPTTQSILAQLAAHPQVYLACSADSPDFPLLWDIGVRSAFNFVFHDCTTFVPFTVELDVVDDVHELLGRKSHRVNGRDGVAFVLKSLPENAKNLFRLLVGEVLIAMEEEGAGADDNTGVEYRMVYNKAVEEFVCTSEMAFRTLLKEFHDHQIITSHKDALGTELLSVPFRKDELEAILEDLMG